MLQINVFFIFGGFDFCFYLCIVNVAGWQIKRKRFLGVSPLDMAPPKFLQQPRLGGVSFIPERQEERLWAKYLPIFRVYKLQGRRMANRRN